jgi:predicted RNA-binding Zn ribbon-like protein
VAVSTDSTGADALTVESAAESVFGTLLSAEEDGKDRETPQAEADQAEAPQAESEGETEQPEDTQAEQTDEPQPEEPEAQEPEEADAPKYDPDARFKVKVDGEEVEVTLDEMAKGYSRTADYTRKMQALAETRKASEAEIQAARQERAALAENLKLLEAAIAEVTPREPDWDKLRAEHPDQFAKVWAEWQQGQKERAQVREMREQAERRAMEDHFQARQERIKVEQEKLMTAIPAWKDEKVMSAEKAEMVKFVESRGFTVDDLRAIEDHRHLALIREAMLFNKSQEKKPAIFRQIEKVRTTKPTGQTMVRSTPTALQRSLERLAKDRTQEAAASVFRHVIDD